MNPTPDAPVFPARAGMSLRSFAPDWHDLRFPRASGDEPTTLVQEGLNAAFSPRERG